MAGIKFALQHVIDRRCQGIVKALGSLHPEPGHTSETRYAIIKIVKDRRLEVWYDYNDDVRISTELKLGDTCELHVRNNTLAEWVPAKASEVPEILVNVPQKSKTTSSVPVRIITSEDIYRTRGKPEEIVAEDRAIKSYLDNKHKRGAYAKNGRYKRPAER